MSELLRASNVSFAYGERLAVRDVSLALQPGEVVALVGPNGSGKSTLIQVLLGARRARGRVAWDGKQIEAWSRRELARRIAYLPQSPTHQPGQRVRDVLRLGRSPYLQAFGVESVRDVEAVEEVGRELGLSDLLPRDMDTLSGGQRQRVFIGRCLVQGPRAMLLDEPSTYLDIAHQVELCRMLRRLAKERNVAVLMAMHELNLAGAYADRLILLREGAVVVEGTAGDVLRGDVLEDVYGVKMDVLARDGGVVVVPRV